ncbi:hypothetical protein NECAME_17012 [Necator americanus]|uniref:Uncharacterized protein n=1 Tax=Necator americanus TaxID=51031 RepID=W2TT06_NECAM|nr:hypothetical protein NECAME_17012 [Necator americanus]ETN84774.1 hypothetical protein NECAME_17012 [Necator americanus]
MAISDHASHIGRPTLCYCDTYNVLICRLSAEPCEVGREFLVPCGSCCSTLEYQLESFKRQAFLDGFKTLSILRAVVKVFNEPVIFFVDVFHCEIFQKPATVAKRSDQDFHAQKYECMLSQQTSEDNAYNIGANSDLHMHLGSIDRSYKCYRLHQ